jgi:hypothetical protein
MYTTVSPCHVYADGRIVAGSGDCGPHALDFPQDVEATPDGGLVLAERSRVSRIAPDGTHSVLHPEGADGLEVTPDGDVLFSTGGRIYRYDGNFVPRTVTPPWESPAPPAVPPPPVPAPPARPVATPTAILSRRAYTVTRGRRLRLTFTASRAGRYRLDVTRGGRRVKRLSGSARAGRNTRTFKVTLKPGRYALRLTPGTRVATLRVKR